MTRLTPMTGQARFGNSALLLKNSKLILKDCLKGSVENIGDLKDNAFILSAIIQSTGRVYTVAQSAKKTRNKPEGPYRYMEGMKTFFREVLGLTLNFLVLRTFQRVMVDVLRHYFRVTTPLGKAPIQFMQNIWAGIFSKGKHLPLPPELKQGYPGLFQSLQKLGGEVGHFLNGTAKPYQAVQYKPKVTYDWLHAPGLHFENTQRYQKWEGWINPLNGLVGKLTGKTEAQIKALTPSQKLETVCDWLPVFVGSIPSVLFAGFWLEWFTQNKSEKVAKTLYAKLNPQSQALAQVPTPAASTPMPQPQPLVSWPQLSYAVNPWFTQLSGWRPHGFYTAPYSANPFTHPSA